MQPVPIYYDNNEDETTEKYSEPKHINQHYEKKARWHPEPRFIPAPVVISPDQWTDLFPDEDYGDYESDIREVERRYNEDRIQFYSADIHDPELIPCAEQLRDTLAEVMTAARLIFDKLSFSHELKLCAMAVMNRVLKDCYALEDAVSKHAKWMMDQYPEDEVLHFDMTEIDSLFLDFYLDVYNTIGNYKKKSRE